MKFFELLEQTYIQDIRRSVKDSLVSLKIQGFKRIKTDQALKYFKDQGLSVGYKSLIELMGVEPMIDNINRKFITFAQEGDIESNSKDKVDQDKESVKQMAKKKIDKNMQESNSRNSTSWKTVLRNEIDWFNMAGNEYNDELGTGYFRSAKLAKYILLKAKSLGDVFRMVDIFGRDTAKNGDFADDIFQHFEDAGFGPEIKAFYNKQDSK